MDRKKSSPEDVDARPSSVRRRLLLYSAVGVVIALALVVIPDLMKPDHAEAISIPNPLDELKDLAGDALGSASDAVGAPLKTGFVWMVNTLFGGPQAEITMALVKYLTTMPNFATGSVMGLMKNMQAVAGALLACVLTLSIVRYWIGSYFEGSNMIAGLEGVIKVIFAAIMIAVWPTLFNLAAKFFNVLSASLLTGQLKAQLVDLFSEISGASLLASGLSGPIGASVGMLMWIMIAIASTVLFLGLLMMKIMVTAGTVIVFVGMPLALILWPIPETSWIAKALAKTLVILLAIPVVWVVIFSTAAALGTDVFGASNQEGAEIAQTGLDAIIIKPLVAIALMYMAITIPSKLLRMAPMLGNMRGGGRISGMAMGLGTSMAARGAYSKMAGAGASAASAGKNGNPGQGMNTKLDKKLTPGAFPKPSDTGKTTPGTGTPTPVVAAPVSAPTGSDGSAPAEGARKPASSASMPSGEKAKPEAWTGSAAANWGTGTYNLPINADGKTSPAKATEAGKLKQQWATANASGEGPSTQQAQAAYNKLSPTAQASVSAVAADSAKGATEHRSHMAGAAVADNPNHGAESKTAFATLGAATPEIFQQVAAKAPSSNPESSTPVFGPQTQASSHQVFSSPSNTGAKNGGIGGSPKGTAPEPSAVEPLAQKVTPKTKQGG